jgi:hypothetical protein
MLDEDLMAFGLSLPHQLKVNGRTCKKVLRAVAERRLPSAVANKPKWGFGIPSIRGLMPISKYISERRCLEK